MKLLIMSAMLLIATGCSWFKSASVQAALGPAEKVICDDQTKAIAAISKGIANQFNCANESAVEASLTGVLGNANVCLYAPKAGLKAQGAIANLVCPVGVSAAIGFLTAALPQEWACTVSQNASGVQQALTQICVGAVPL